MLKTIIWLLAAGAAAAAAAAEGPRVNVSSDAVEYSTDGKGAVFRGNVQVSAGGVLIQAATLQVASEDGGNTYVALPASGAALSLTCDDCAEFAIRAEVGQKAEFNAAADLLKLTGGVSVCADAGCRRGTLTAASADWQRRQRLLLVGAPLVRGTWLPAADAAAGAAPLQLRARHITYRFDSGEAVLTGDARITRGDSDITGTVIHLNMKTGALRADSDASQRVQATFGGDG